MQSNLTHKFGESVVEGTAQHNAQTSCARGACSANAIRTARKGYGKT